MLFYKLKGMGLKFKIRKFQVLPTPHNQIYKRMLLENENQFEETISVKSVRSTADYDVKHLDSFGFLYIDKPTLTPFSGLMCSDRNQFYVQILPVSNANGSDRFNHSVGNQFFDVSVFVGECG